MDIMIVTTVSITILMCCTNPLEEKIDFPKRHAGILLAVQINHATRVPEK
jgi:hypothetical protein